MSIIKNHFFAGERILFGLKDAQLEGITFGEGESPLKEASKISIKDSVFKWKYPLRSEERRVGKECKTRGCTDH